MVGSGVPLDPVISGGFSAMTFAEMEEGLKNSDRRVTAIEEILPTLATKIDVERGLAGLKTDLRSSGWTNSRSFSRR